MHKIAPCRTSSNHFTAKRNNAPFPSGVVVAAVVKCDCETLFKEETTLPLSDFHEGPPYKNKLITTIIVKYSKYKN